MATLKEQLIEIVGEVGGNMGNLAGALRERMYAANAAGEFEIARAANALYQDYTYYAMQLGRLQIAAIDESDEMRAAIAALEEVNKKLEDEKERVKDLTNKIDTTAALVTQSEKVIKKVGEVLG